MIFRQKKFSAQNWDPFLLIDQIFNEIFDNAIPDKEGK